MRSAKRRWPDVFAQIDAGLDGDANGGPLANWLDALRRNPASDLLDKHGLGPARRVLRAAARSSALLDQDQWRRHAPNLLRLARRQSDWVRDPEDWRERSHNIERQITSLTRHLFAKFAVPKWLDSAWTGDSGAEQSWFIHVGQGGNLRKAVHLPVPLTKAMAHHAMLAPDGCSVAQAIRYGQARGLEVEPRLARAVLGSRLGRDFDAREEDFWVTFLRWLAQHPMIDPAQVGPIADYLRDQRFVPAGAVLVNGTFVEQGPPQPGLSMQHRCPEALVAQVEAWHRRLARVKLTSRDVSWPSCGVGGYSRVEGEPGRQRRFEIVELCSSAALRAEGAAMKHCVSTYAGSCQSGRVAIFATSVTDEHGEHKRMLTLELDVKTRQIVQARGRFNAPSTPFDQRLLNAWTTTAGLSIAKYAITRAY